MIKVLIVDDSALIRKMLTSILESDPGISVVGTATDPYMAREKIKKLKPDMITLDVEMPKMDGVTFLRNLMRLHPLPVLMVSSLTEKGADITLQALEAGAIDFVTKPKVDLANSFEGYGEEIVEKVKMVACANVKQVIPRKSEPTPSDQREVKSSLVGGKVVPKKFSTDVVLQKSQGKRHFQTTDKVVAIGASTGGTEAIREVLEDLPPGMPGVVIVQHIPAAFSRPFAERMNLASPMNVMQAEDGQQIIPGHVYIAPGDRHLIVVRDGARYICRLNDGELVNRHKPSVDVLFRSMAENVGPNGVGVILTGMGGDGALGLKEMLDVNAQTIAQDERTSVVWGMPGEAVKAGGAKQVLPLNEVAEAIQNLVSD
ncbi:MAG: chemotaxis response regulator protein-glutamate methylesterase [Gammaproteobacteria bacterium]|jgi:two-component system chemotaxis response regulator CheB|nr:chemotaxis response regulator protein-glutamate methylesterase [Gammaproteobacteria bacterium]MBT3489901.1 chemotaxis response regulator protein-glutamate methylesterase [Gammaproteobacteria bacterium]MBT3719240.1 chemotaxis response regulator protein-glutamate methylesterase [Gammaproteobacteria bacterium]MBT3846034.1 chemotaxis response regulator protein-glutamate methylesterase [Gammaproteobacteria bacterium]MBT3893546.1 chemotaxis response regulator protein-glutamate methylesterase [Gamm